MEARAASALNHPNIVSVHDHGCDNGIYWIASELVRGDTLRRRCNRMQSKKNKRLRLHLATDVKSTHKKPQIPTLTHEIYRPNPNYGGEAGYTTSDQPRPTRHAAASGHLTFPPPAR